MNEEDYIDVETIQTHLEKLYMCFDELASKAGDKMKSADNARTAREHLLDVICNEAKRDAIKSVASSLSITICTR